MGRLSNLKRLEELGFVKISNVGSIGEYVMYPIPRSIEGRIAFYYDFSKKKVVFKGFDEKLNEDLQRYKNFKQFYDDAKKMKEEGEGK